MADDDFKKIKPGSWMLQYVKDVSIPPNSDASNMEMKVFRTYLGLMWFVLWDKSARESMLAGRVNLMKISKDPPLPDATSPD